jgi:cell division protein FtsW
VSRGDRWLLALPLMLTAVGIVMVYSSSAILGITRYQDPNYYFLRQLARVGLGLVVMVIAMRIDLRRLEAAAPVLFGVALFVLGIVAVSGHMSNGATRWLKIGILTLQPTDGARLALVVFLAWWFKSHPPAERGFFKGAVPALAAIGAVAVLVLVQPNLSSAGMLIVIGLTVLFLAGTPLLHLSAPLVPAVVMAVVAVATHPYMMKRVKSYVDFIVHGSLDPRGSGWQLDQSLIAIGSGGWFGRGLGGGLQKYLFLPEAHTDFIFSILAEEIGFLGSTLLLALFVLLVWRGFRTAARATDPFASLLAAGLTVQLALYAVVNIAVATGLAPTTGLPLPFVSYGGSALLANLAAAGLLYRVSRMNGAEEALTRQRWSREQT